MTVENVRRILGEAGLGVLEEKRLPNDTGWQLRLKTGQVVNVYDTGKTVVQGKKADGIRALLSAEDSQSLAKSAAATRNVFVVYGHDEDAKTQLEAMLRRWDLEPLFLDQLPSEGQTIIEKLEKHGTQAHFAVVLATPDDEGYRAGHPDEVAFRVRQNVVLELGMMLSLLGRSRVAILLKNQVKMERPSDIQGLIYIPFKEDIKEVALVLAKEMSAQGLHIDLAKV